MSIFFPVRFFRAMIGLVVLNAGSVSDCGAQDRVVGQDGLRIAATDTLKWTRFRLPSVFPVGLRTEDLCEVALLPESKKRIEPSLFVRSEPRFFERQTEIQGDNRTGSIPGQSATMAERPGDANSGPGNLQSEATDAFRWEGAVRQSLFFLGILHAGRMATEPESRAGFRGPFFKDYFATVKTLRGWRDADRFIVNYVAHPMQGAVSGYVQIHNDPKATRQELGMGKSYWHSRLKAMGWAALFSTQFELGPISEASLGNVGLKVRDKTNHPMAWVDLIVTPTVGTAWLVGEDILDRYVVRRVENKVSNRLIRVLVRSFLNPSRSFANVLRIKYPWHRDTRKLGP